MSKNINTLTDATFENDVLNSNIPVLVDFWAEWCMPCRFVAPVIEQVADEYTGKIKVGKLDVDQNPRIAGQFGINSIPSILLYKNGQVVDGVIGAVPKEQLVNMLDKHLSPEN